MERKAQSKKKKGRSGEEGINGEDDVETVCVRLITSCPLIIQVIFAGMFINKP